MTSPDHRVPVLVVGGGLAGLSAAVLLGWRGISCLLVERHPSVAAQPRARGVNLRSMELLRAVPGLEAELAAAGRAGTDDFTMVVAESVTGREFHRMVVPGYVDPKSLSPAAICTAGQDRVEPILLRYAKAHGAKVLFGTELTDFEQDGRGVRAVLRDLRTGEQTAIVADYMIAADGNRSSVRQKLSIGVHGHGTLSHNMSILFEADLGAVLRGRGFVHYQIRGRNSPASLSAPMIRTWVRWRSNTTSSLRPRPITRRNAQRGWSGQHLACPTWRSRCAMSCLGSARRRWQIE